MIVCSLLLQIRDVQRGNLGRGDVVEEDSSYLLNGLRPVEIQSRNQELSPRQLIPCQLTILLIVSLENLSIYSVDRKEL